MECAFLNNSVRNKCRVVNFILNRIVYSINLCLYLFIKIVINTISNRITGHNERGTEQESENQIVSQFFIIINL